MIDDQVFIEVVEGEKLFQCIKDNGEKYDEADDGPQFGGIVIVAANVGGVFV